MSNRLIREWGLVVALVGLAVTAPPVAFANQEPESVAETYSKLCVPCHGAEGRGDGVAAIALNPRPPDFASEQFDEYTIEQILAGITAGKGAMPAWGAVLPADRIRQLAEYVDSLRGRSEGDVRGDGGTP